MVVTSSVVAVSTCLDPMPNPITEEHWSVEEKMNGVLPLAYQLSKYLAEKAAWDFVKSLPESEKFELVCINPGLVLGATPLKTGFTSGALINAWMNGKNGVSGWNIPCVEVDAVADAHY